MKVKAALKLYIIAFFLTSVCCSDVLINSQCGKSHFQEKFSRICAPKFCGIRTVSLENKNDFIRKLKQFTKILFDAIDDDIKNDNNISMDYVNDNDNSLSADHITDKVNTGIVNNVIGKSDNIKASCNNTNNNG